MKLNQIDCLNKIKELCKLLKVCSVFDQEHVLNVRRDISIWKVKFRKIEIQKNSIQT